MVKYFDKITIQIFLIYITNRHSYKTEMKESHISTHGCYILQVHYLGNLTLCKYERLLKRERREINSFFSRC